MPERSYKITCDECGYSEIVPISRLSYEEGKTCPKCYKGTMWWVPPAEEVRRRELKKMLEEEKGISPAVIILQIGMGLCVAAIVGLCALTRIARPEKIELQPGRNAVKWTGGPTHVEDALAEIINYVQLFLVLRETDQEWIEITRDIWDTWAIPRDQICLIYVDRACTVTGFVWAE